eukprot:6426815-Amphidinium_carterae.1
MIAFHQLSDIFVSLWHRLKEHAQQELSTTRMIFCTLLETGLQLWCQAHCHNEYHIKRAFSTSCAEARSLIGSASSTPVVEATVLDARHHVLHRVHNALHTQQVLCSYATDTFHPSPRWHVLEHTCDLQGSYIHMLQEEPCI